MRTRSALVLALALALALAPSLASAAPRARVAVRQPRAALPRPPLSSVGEGVKLSLKLGHEELASTVAIGDEILDRYPPSEYLHVIVGRAPSLLHGYLQLIEPDSVVNLPLSGVRDRRLTPAEIAEVSDVMARTVEPARDGRKIVLIGAVAGGNSLPEAKQAAEARLGIGRVEAIGLQLNQTRRPTTGDSIAGRRGERIPLIDLRRHEELSRHLLTSRYDVVAEFNGYYPGTGQGGALQRPNRFDALTEVIHEALDASPALRARVDARLARAGAAAIAPPLAPAPTVAPARIAAPVAAPALPRVVGGAGRLAGPPPMSDAASRRAASLALADLEVEAAVTLSNDILQRYPPDQYFHVIVGRSASLIHAYMDLLDPRIATNMPISGLRERQLSADDRAEIHGLIDHFIAAERGRRKVVLIDSVSGGKTIREIKELAEERLGVDQVEAVGLVYNGVRHLRGSSILGARGETIPLLSLERFTKFSDNLAGERYESLAEHGSFFLGRGSRPGDVTRAPAFDDLVEILHHRIAGHADLLARATAQLQRMGR